MCKSKQVSFHVKVYFILYSTYSPPQCNFKNSLIQRNNIAISNKNAIALSVFPAGDLMCQRYDKVKILKESKNKHEILQLIRSMHCVGCPLGD